jgi:hypothetical protein
MSRSTKECGTVVMRFHGKFKHRENCPQHRNAESPSIGFDQSSVEQVMINVRR